MYLKRVKVESMEKRRWILLYYQISHRVAVIKHDKQSLRKDVIDRIQVPDEILDQNTFKAP